MTDRAFSAHPMLEPADYDLTPEKARERLRLTGDQLNAYTLLWHAALATLQDGPTIRRQTLMLGFAPDHSSILTRYEVRIHEDLVESDGWASGTLACELDRLAPNRVSTVSPQLQSQIAAVPTQLVDGGWRVRTAGALTAVAESLPQSALCKFRVVQHRPEKLPMDVLLEQMSRHRVGRPSTYAAAIERAQNQQLIQDDGGLTVGPRGTELLDLLAKSGGGAFSANACEALGNDLADVEGGLINAGDVLRKHAERMLAITPALADWLDNLAIDGETIEQAMDRVSKKPPLANGWSGVDLPAGISPISNLTDHGAALALREELDSQLSGLDPELWRAADTRGRALVRLAALCWLTGCPAPARLRTILRQANRDLVYRWWIDLPPTELAASMSELIVAMRILRRQLDNGSQQRPGFLHELLKALR